MLGRFGHPLAPIPKQPGVRILRGVELYLAFFRAVFQAESLGAQESHFESGFDGTLEIVQFLYQAEDFRSLGPGEFKRERQGVIRRFLVHRLAALLESDLHVGGSAPRKGFGIEEPLRILRHKRTGEQQNQRPLHAHLQASLRLVASWVAWQMAMARASDASSLGIASGKCSKDRTITCT